jgi:hypothetical protein
LYLIYQRTKTTYNFNTQHISHPKFLNPENCKNLKFTMGICTSKTNTKKKTTRYSPAPESSQNKYLATPSGSRQTNEASQNPSRNRTPSRVYKDVSAPNSRRNSVILKQKPDQVSEEYLDENYCDFEILKYSKELVKQFFWRNLTTFCAYFLWIFEVSNFEKLLLT